MVNCSVCNDSVEVCVARLRKLYANDKDKLLDAFKRHKYTGELSHGVVKLDLIPKPFSIRRKPKRDKLPYHISFRLSQEEYSTVSRVASNLGYRNLGIALRKIIRSVKHAEDIY